MDFTKAFTFHVGYENNENLRVSKRARGIAMAFIAQKITSMKTQADQVKICR